MAKALDAPYEAGSRGASWLKVKRAHTLDLVVLAAEWGNGRRQRLAVEPAPRRARPGAGGWVMLGKTFKGMTDELLEWQTRELLARESRRDGYTSCTCGRSWWSRSRSTTCRRARNTPAAWRCASRASRATGPTSGGRRGHDRDGACAARGAARSFRRLGILPVNVVFRGADTRFSRRSLVEERGPSFRRRPAMPNRLRSIAKWALMLTMVGAVSTQATNYSLWVKGRGAGGVPGNHADFSYWGRAAAPPASTRSRRQLGRLQPHRARTAASATRSTATAPAQLVLHRRLQRRRPADRLRARPLRRLERALQEERECPARRRVRQHRRHDADRLEHQVGARGGRRGGRQRSWPTTATGRSPSRSCPT